LWGGVSGGRLLKWEITAEKVLMAMLAATFIMLCITFA
jgi:cell division protein FtsL